MQNGHLTRPLELQSRKCWAGMLKAVHVLAKSQHKLKCNFCEQIRQVNKKWYYNNEKKFYGYVSNFTQKAELE